MRIVNIIYDFAIVKLDIEILVDGVHCAADGQVILQLYSYFLADQLFEIRKEQLRKEKSEQRKASQDPHSCQIPAGINTNAVSLPSSCPRGVT